MNRAESIVSRKQRGDLIQRSAPTSKTSEEISVVLEYSDQDQSVKHIINKYIPVLYEDEITEQILCKGYRIVSRNLFLWVTYYHLVSMYLTHPNILGLDTKVFTDVAVTDVKHATMYRQVILSPTMMVRSIIQSST